MDVVSECFEEASRSLCIEWCSEEVTSAFAIWKL